MAQNLSSDSDQELARAAQAGSLDAFERLVYRYEHRVHAFVTQFCRNATDAREVTQDTFVKAFQSMGQFDSRRAFAAWLFTIARRKCIDQHRSAFRVTDAAVPELSDHTDPSELAARREDGQDLWHLARQCLNENQFQALWLHYVEDMNVAQIAQALRKTRVHIKVILFRARQILGRELNPRLAPGEANLAASPRPVLTILANQPSTLPPSK
ncbi:MAG TPA: sigma-70 family RNA polymerase sigma factor [Verrucomicrobiae bacterium]|nr:sigma-70 family RNA polymerase sigma factor [Verrucomicrobiae bacterium]